MATTQPWSIIVDNVRLDTYAKSVTSRTWDYTPGLVGDNVRVPGRDGTIWKPKDYDEGRLVLEILVSGTDDNNTVPYGSTEEKEFRKNLDHIMALFGKRSGLIPITKEMADGTARINYGEVKTVISPDYAGPRPFATVKVELVFPSPLWSDTSGSRDYVINGPGSGGQILLSLTSMAGATAPCNDPTILVVGPANSPTIYDPASAVYVNLYRNLSASETWRLRPASFTSEVGGGLGFVTGSGMSVIDKTAWYNPGMYAIHPVPGGTPSVQLNGSAFTTGTALKVRATRRFVS